MTRNLSPYASSIVPDLANRASLDFYRTPKPMTESLIMSEDLSGTVWEPACGDGAISEVFKSRGIDVVSSDVVDRGYGIPGVDFLTCQGAPRPFGFVVTNPPFSDPGRRDLVRLFVERAIELGSKKTCVLARLMWLESKKRKDFFQSSGMSRVWVFSDRQNVARDGWVNVRGNKGKGMIVYAWYVWERGHVGPPTLGWL